MLQRADDPATVKAVSYLQLRVHACVSDYEAAAVEHEEDGALRTFGGWGGGDVDVCGDLEVVDGFVGEAEGWGKGVGHGTLVVSRVTSVRQSGCLVVQCFSCGSLAGLL